MNTSIEKVTKFLRWSGGISMVISMILFMITGRYDMNSLSAHYLFLGLNVVLCTLGIISSTVWKDQKTARTFLGLSLGIVPAQFAQLGAFFYSQYIGISKHIPDALQLTLPNGVGLTAITAISVLTLIPIIYLGFSSLNRADAKKMSLTYMLTSLAIIIPFRDTFAVSGIILAVAILIIYTLLTTANLKTFEGRISRFILFNPLFIIVGRSLFYPLDSLFYTFLFSSITMIMFSFLPTLTENKELKIKLQALSIPTALLAIFTMIEMLNISTSFFLLGSVIYFYIISQFCIGTGRKYRDIGSAILPISLLFVFEAGGLLIQSASLIVPIALLAFAIYKKEKTPFAFAATTLIIFGGWQLAAIITIPTIGMWQMTAATSIILIISASIIERKFTKIKSTVTTFYQQLN